MREALTAAARARPGRQSHAPGPATDVYAVSGTADATEEVCARAGRLVLGALGQAGGVAALSAAHETVTAHHGDKYLPLVERFCWPQPPPNSLVSAPLAPPALAWLPSPPAPISTPSVTPWLTAGRA